MTQVILTGNRYLSGQSYPTIASEIVLEIKQGSTWDEEFFVSGDFTGWDVNFYVSKKFGESRIAIGRVTGLSFGNFTIPVLDENGNPVFDDNGNPVVRELNDYTYFRLIIDSNITAEMDVSPMSFKEIATPKAGRDYWQADLEASRTVSGVLEVEPLGFDLVPVVVRGET